MPIRTWKAALSQFAIKFEGRFPIGVKDRLHSFMNRPGKPGLMVLFILEI